MDIMVTHVYQPLGSDRALRMHTVTEIQDFDRHTTKILSTGPRFEADV